MDICVSLSVRTVSCKRLHCTTMDHVGVSQDAEEHRFTLLELPHELLVDVLVKLNAKDLVRVGAVNKTLSRITRDVSLDKW